MSVSESGRRLPPMLTLATGALLLLAGCRGNVEPPKVAEKPPTPTSVTEGIKLDQGVAAKLRDYDLLILHGWNGNPRSEFLGALTDIFAEARIPTDVPQLPGGADPKDEEWIKILGDKITTGKPKMVMAYSLGATAALDTILKRPDSQVEVLISVALITHDPAKPDESLVGSLKQMVREFQGQQPQISHPHGFFDKVGQFPEVIGNRQLKRWILVQSANDPNMPMDEVLDLARMLGINPTDCLDGDCELPSEKVSMLLVGPHGHFNNPANADILVKITNQLGPNFS